MSHNLWLIINDSYVTALMILQQKYRTPHLRPIVSHYIIDVFQVEWYIQMSGT